jgi:hypothetical protein
MREYGIGVKDIFKMSWRRFRVLFDAVFTTNTEEEFDWNAELDKAIGRQTPTNVQKMDLAEYQERYA